jgi:TonB family protein
MKIIILLTTAAVAIFTLAMPEIAWAQATRSNKVSRQSNQTKKQQRELPRVVVSDGPAVLNGRALALVTPRYPAIARKGHAKGTVVVKVLIDEEGNVIEARVISGHPLLWAVSVEAAKNSLFSPTMMSGTPVRVTGVIQYNFIEGERSEVAQAHEAAAQKDEKVLDVCLQDCDKVTSDSSVLKGHALKLAKPEYPASARDAGVSGSVEVRVLLDEKGKVISAQAVSGDPLLRDVCVEAAKNSLFSPTLLAGTPVKVTGIIRYNFVGQ